MRESATRSYPRYFCSLTNANNSLIVVGVKQGGANRIQVILPKGEQTPNNWEAYVTTRQVECLKVDALAIKDGIGQMDLPDEAILTLVGKIPKAQ